MRYVDAMQSFSPGRLWIAGAPFWRLLMTWLIALFALAAVMGSVMWLRPSPAQQRQARLRERARQLGLDVRLAPLPQTRRARVRKESADSGVVYRLMRFDLTAMPAQLFVLVREAGAEEWERQSPTELSPAVVAVIEKVLPRLPRDVVAVELTPQGPGFYWREQGDDETVATLRTLLGE